LPDGTSWDDRREAAADLMIETVNQYAPTAGDQSWRGKSFRRSILSGHLASWAAIFFTALSICGRCSRRARCWVTRITAFQFAASIYAAPEAIQAEASRARQATMPRMKSCAISSASVLPDSRARRANICSAGAGERTEGQ
jgi:hypothetical protein